MTSSDSKFLPTTFPGNSIRISTSEDSEQISEDEGEILVVKVKAARILPAKEERIYGTVVITSEFFIFEPDTWLTSQLELNKNYKLRAYSESIEHHPASVCIDLSSIQSMNTHNSCADLIFDLANRQCREISPISKNSPLNIKQDGKIYLCLRILNNSSIIPTIYEFNSNQIDEVLACLLQSGINLHSPLGLNRFEFDEPFTLSRRLSISLDTLDWEIVEVSEMLEYEKFKSSTTFTYVSIQNELPNENNPKKLETTSTKKSNNETLIMRLFHRKTIKNTSHHGSSSEVSTKNSTLSGVPFQINSNQFVLEFSEIESEILSSQDMLDEIGRDCPSHLKFSKLIMVYSTKLHGFSLPSIYRKMNQCNSQKFFTLLLLRDIQGTIFGAVLSDPIKLSPNYYGKGETFVFHWKNRSYKSYKWSKANDFFMIGDTKYFSVGADSGKNAIWIDPDLKNGRSEYTITFKNPILCSDENPAFIIDKLEVFRFIT